MLIALNNKKRTVILIIRLIEGIDWTISYKHFTKPNTIEPYNMISSVLTLSQVKHFTEAQPSAVCMKSFCTPTFFLGMRVSIHGFLQCVYAKCVCIHTFFQCMYAKHVYIYAFLRSMYAKRVPLHTFKRKCVPPNTLKG